MPADAGPSGSAARRAVLVFRSRGAPAIGLAVATLISFVGTLPLLAALRQPGETTSNQVYEDFASGSLSRPDRLISVDGFQLAADHGWYLAPAADGRLVYRVPGYPGASTRITLWLYLPYGVTNSVSVSTPDLPPLRISTNAQYAGSQLQIPAQYATALSLDVLIEAHNSSAAQQLIIDSIVTASVAGSDPRAPPAYSFVLFGSLVGLITFFILRRRPHPIPTSVGVGAVVAVATAARISALFALHNPLDPDAVGYRIYADRFQWWPLFDNGIFSGNFAEREPLFPMVVHVYFQVLGSTDFHLRVVSATLSVAVVILSIVAARRRLETWWAPLLVGVAVAVSGPLILESDRGLRLELETLLILGLYLALDRGPARTPLLDAVLIGLLGAAMALARTYFIPVFVVAVAVSFLVRYRSIPKVIGLIVVATLIMGGAEAAHRFGLYEHQGNAFWDTAGYARWNANEELFRYHRPLPHPELFPTLRQYQAAGPYTGPSVSTYQYLFVIHSPLELARDSLAGSHLVFDSVDSLSVDVRAAVDFHKLPSSLAPIAMSLASRSDLLLRWTMLLGLLAMCILGWRDPRLLIIPAIVATWLGMTAFLLDHSLLEKYRHTWQTYPLALIAGAWLLEKTALVAWPRIQPRRIFNVEVALAAAALLLTLATSVAPHSALYPAVALVGGAVAVLSYRRPAWGVSAALLAVGAAGGLVGAVAALGSAIAVLVRLRPELRLLVPLLALLPLGLAIVITGRPFSPASVETAAILVALVTAFAVATREPAVREEIIWLLAAVGPLAAIMAIPHPSAPGVVELAPAGVIAAAWLSLKGHRAALLLGLLDLALVLFVEPFAAWVAVAIIVAWMAVHAGRVPRSRRLILAGGVAAVIAALTAGASLAATTPSQTAAWSARLDSPTYAVRQDIVVDRPGDNSIWIYARRSSAFSDFPFSLLVNGTPLTTDLNSSLPTDVMSWNRILLGETPRVGQRLQITVVAAGQPNAVNRFIEVGGVYATVDDIRSPGLNGTYLIVLGDDSMPLAPDGLPEPMVRDRLQPPMGAAMPGELGAPVESRQEAGVLQIWQQVLEVAQGHPGGVGTGNLGSALQDSGAGLGPGLSARSEPLQALGEWGFFGLGALLLLLAVAAWSAGSARDPLALALLGVAVITMLGESLLADPAGAASVWLAVGFCFGAIASRATAQSTSPASDGETRPETSQPEATRAC